MTATVALTRASRDRWFARRRRGITATEAPVILGLAPWADITQLSVWLDKHNPQPRRSDWRKARGHALEGPLAREFALAHPGTLMERPPMLLAHPKLPWLLASLDWLAHDRDRTRVVECKTGTDWRDWDDGATPVHYLAQLQIQLCVTGLDEGVLWADVDGRLHERVIARDDNWLAEALPILRRWWWAHVALGRVPPLDPADYCHLNDVWRPAPGLQCDADPRIAEMVARLRHIQAAQKRRGDDVDRLKVAIRAHMAHATTLLDPETGNRLASITRGGALRIDRPREDAA